MPLTENSLQLRTEQVLWQPDGDSPAPISIVASEEMLYGTEMPEVLWVPGLGELESSARKILQRGLGEAGLSGAAVILHYDKVKPRDMVQYASEALLIAADYFDDTAKIYGGADSLGGYALGYAGGVDPERFGAASFISPAGPSNRELGESLAKRVATLTHRLTVKNTARAHFDPHIALSQPDLWRTIFSHARHRQLFGALDVGTDSTVGDGVTSGIVTMAHAGVPVEVRSPSRDGVYTTKAYRHFLEGPLVEAGMDVEDILKVTRGTHPVAQTRDGQRQIKESGEWLRSVRDRDTYEETVGPDRIALGREVITVTSGVSPAAEKNPVLLNDEAASPEGVVRRSRIRRILGAMTTFGAFSRRTSTDNPYN